MEDVLDDLKGHVGALGTGDTNKVKAQSRQQRKLHQNLADTHTARSSEEGMLMHVTVVFVTMTEAIRGSFRGEIP